MDIKKLLEEHEHETLELKEAFGKDVFEAVCAFSNARGGVVLIGVADDTKIKGVQIGKRTMESWANDIKQALEPSVNPSVSTARIDSKTVGVIQVERHKTAAVSYGGRFFKRVGKTNHTMTFEDIINHANANYDIGWDGVTQDLCKFKDLDAKLIKKFLADVAEAQRWATSSEAPESALIKLHLLQENGDPTRAALLLLGKNPQKHYPNAYVKVGRFKTPTHIIDEKEIRGTLFNQIDESLLWLKERLTTELVITGNPQREIRWQFPLEALREAIANAICHRDYRIDSAVQIRLFDDRLEIWNPGTLPSQLTVEDLLRVHQSFPRNKRIHEALYNCGVVERWGSGTLRMADFMRAMNLPKPVFESSMENVFRVILKQVAFDKEQLESMELNDRQIKLVLRSPNNITNTMYQKMFKVSKRTATRELAQLVDLGVLIRRGSSGSSISYTVSNQ